MHAMLVSTSIDITYYNETAKILQSIAIEYWYNIRPTYVNAESFDIMHLSQILKRFLS